MLWCWDSSMFQINSCHWNLCSKSLSKNLDLFLPLHSCLPSIPVCDWHSAFSFLAKFLTIFFGFVHISFTSCLTHASDFSKDLWPSVFPPHRDSHSKHQVRELNSKWIQHNRRMNRYSSFISANNTVPFFLISLCIFNKSRDCQIYIYLTINAELGFYLHAVCFCK